MKGNIVKFIQLLLIVTFIGCSSSENLSDSTIKEARYNEGYIVRADGTKEYGRVKSFEPYKYTKVFFIHEDGPKEMLDVRDLKKFGYNHREFVVMGTSFYEVLIRGRNLNLYVTKQKQTETIRKPGVHVYNHLSNRFESISKASEGVYSYDFYYYIRRVNSDELMKVNAANFTRIFSKEFSDCPILQSYIVEEKFVFENLLEVINKYNQCI